MHAVRALIAVPAGAVASGAVLATGHGLHAVALAANVADPIAWVYPVITDGLALVAYVTAHYVPDHKRYAWVVTLLASIMSGAAQAVFLAGAAVTASAGLRFAIGAWPAAAALLGGHLLYLLFRAWADADRAAAVAAAEAAEAARAAQVAAHVAAIEAAEAARATAERDDTEDVRPNAPVVTMAPRRAQPATPPRRRASMDDVDHAKAKRLVEGGGYGRTTLARELGTTKPIARRLIDLYKGTDADGDAEDVDESEAVRA